MLGVKCFDDVTEPDVKIMDSCGLSRPGTRLVESCLDSISHG